MRIKTFFFLSYFLVAKFEQWRYAKANALPWRNAQRGIFCLWQNLNNGVII
jgi:hypothetical protein